MLTPIPGAEAETVYVPPGQSREVDPDATYFGGAPSMPPPSAEDAETIFQTARPHTTDSTPYDAAATADTTGLPFSKRDAGQTVPPAEPIESDTTGLPASAGGARQAKKGPLGPLQVGQQFGARYHILRQLGIGGMGAVYQAWDAELEVAVALKVIRPEVTRDPAAAQDIERRFKQELLLARQVTHKNVVRIHDLGEIDGIKYITMPYIQGSDLATVLRGEKLTIPKVIAIARQIASGLQAAHEAGVVHRDLKPANVMIENEEHAIIMDFGIARSTSRGGSANAGRPVAVGATFQPATEDDELTRIAATVVGEVIGTIEYMAPEQARGEHVDQRADVYAFGLILYDMLTGKRRSEHAVSAVGELQKRLAEPPPPVKSVVPAVPDALDAFVTRCVEPDLEKRFQTTAEVVAALDLLDDNGKLRPIKRVVGMPLAVAIAAGLLALSGYIYWATRPPVVHEPVSVVIADFTNNTGDAALNGTIETAMQRALEGATFISAYDRAGIRRVLGVAPPEKLDEAGALALAVQQGVGVVLSGSVDTDNRGYRLAVRAVRAVTGEVILTTNDRASNRDQVLASVTDLATDVRKALGDDESESAQRFAKETLSATSIDVVRDYAGAMDALSRSQYADALKSFSSAVDRDQNFGLAYAGMAISYFNLYRQQDAEKYAKAAMDHVTGMTPRERFRTRGLYFLVTSDYQSCVKEYNDLITQYDADAAARNNLALCSTQLRQWPRALEEMRRAVQILPKRALYKGNLAVYLSYSGDFAGAQDEGQQMDPPTLLGQTAVAFAQVGEEKLSEARETYQSLDMFNGGPSRRISGLGDLAIYEGRYAEAERILEEGVSLDMKNEAPDRAASKLVALAYARARAGRNRQANAALEEALKASQAVKIRFLAARIFLQTGVKDRAQQLAAELAMEFLAEPRAYAKIIEADAALDGGDARKAATVLMEANQLFDTWIGHLDLGRAFVEARQFPQADSEFDRCFMRRGEALALFLDEEPTYGYLPELYYDRGKRLEAGGTAVAEAYKQYMSVRGTSTEDRLAQDIRKRSGS